MLSFSGGGGGVGGLLSCSGSDCGSGSGTATMVGGGEDGTEEFGCGERLLNPTDAASVVVENRCEGFWGGLRVCARLVLRFSACWLTVFPMLSRQDSSKESVEGHQAYIYIPAKIAVLHCVPARQRLFPSLWPVLLSNNLLDVSRTESSFKAG